MKLFVGSTGLGNASLAKKSNDKGSQCPKSHPTACRQFDEKGPDGCDIECSRGKFHRSVCEKLLKGECLRKAGQCKWYHPPLLSKKVLAERKKKEEEEDKQRDEVTPGGVETVQTSPLPTNANASTYLSIATNDSIYEQA